MDLNGQSAGALATAVMAAWAAATAFWMAVGAVIWRLFFEPRVKALEGQLTTQKAESAEASRAERQRCEREMAEMGRRFDQENGDLRDRVKQLELLLLLHGPQALRQQMQAALSEQHVELDQVKRDAKP